MTAVFGPDLIERSTRRALVQRERTPGVRHAAPSTREGALADARSLLGGVGLRGRGNASVRAAMLLQLQQAGGNRALQRYVHSTRYVQRASPTTAPPVGDDLGRRIQRRAESGTGIGLDGGIRARLETGLGADLSQVRVHTDSEADALARSVDAAAFTSGQDIFFRSGAYDPSTPEGMHLLAHEAVHTVQQSQGPVDGSPAPGGVVISHPSDSHEQAATRTADRLIAGPHPLSDNAGTTAQARATRAGSVGPAQGVQRRATPYAAGTVNVQRGLFSGLGKVLKGVGEAVGGVVSSVGKMVGGVGKALAGKLVSGVLGRVGALKDRLAKGAGKLARKVRSVGGKLWGKLKSVGGKLAKGAGKLFKRIGGLTGKVMRRLKSFGSKLKKGAGKLVSRLKSLGDKVWGKLKRVGRRLFARMRKLSGTFKALKSRLMGRLKSLAGKLRTGARKLVGSLKRVGGRLFRGLKSLGSRLRKGASRLFGKLKSYGSKLLGRAKQIAGGLLGKVFAGIGSLTRKIFGGIKQVGGRVLRGLKKVGGKIFGGVSKLFGKLKQVGGKLLAGAKKLFGKLKQVGGKLWGKLKAAGKKLWGGLKQVGGTLWQVAKWVGNKLKTGLEDLGRWAINLVRDFPERLKRLAITIAEGMVGVVTFLPEALSVLLSQGFKGLGNWLVDKLKGGAAWAGTLLSRILDMVGGPELLEFLEHLISASTTPLTSEEIAAGRAVLGPNAVRWNDVRVCEGGWLDIVFKKNEGRAFTSFHTINLPEGERGDLDLMVHELTHVYQYEKVGSLYIGEALHAQATSGYSYGGPEGLQAARESGKHYKDFNREQQAQIAQDYYEIRFKLDQPAPEYEPFIAELRAGQL